MRKLLASSFLAASLVALPAFAQGNDTIRAGQQALKDKGFDPGPVDGVQGPQTRAALKKYQASQNLNADGRFGPKTLDSLGVKDANPKSNFKASGENVKNSYSQGGKTVAEGTKDMADQMKDGHVGAGAADFGKGVGKGVAKMGVGTGHAAKNVAKGVKNAVVGDSNKPQ
jgi:peptidoglycan hydrolase-like protein with peptidoglycan-binding domain